MFLILNPRFLYLAALALACVGARCERFVVADTLVAYNFDSQTPVASTVIAGLTASTFQSSTALSYFSGNPTTGFGVSTSGFAPSNFYNFTLTPSATTALSLSSLTLDDRISASGPTSLSLQYALGGSSSYTTIGGPIATSTAFSATPMINFSLSSVAALQNDTSPISFRLVGANAPSSGGTLRLDNVALNGATAVVTPPPPPPATSPTGYLRIATYNVTGESGSVRSGFESIIQGMGNESVQGHAESVDALVLEESSLKTGSTGASNTADDVVAKLNAVYGANTYADVPLIGASTGAGTQALVYKTSSLSIVSAATVGDSSIDRQELRYQVRPVGTAGAYDFYIYAGHWRADSGSSNASLRNVEAQEVRADSATLGANARIIYAGDFNLYNSSEAAYGTLTAAGVGAAVDPANQVGSWHNNAAYVGIDTQSPAVTPPAGFASGGLNDRFDFELDTGNIVTGNGNGLTYVPGTYETFGNNGSVPLSGNINDPSSTALSDLSNRLDILNDLTTQSDHLPVMADYYYTLLLGDANGDGVVDLNDLNTVLNHLGATSSLRTNGNFDGGATIDLNDLNDVLNNLGTGIAASASPQAQAVPEAGSLLLLVVGMGMLLPRRVRRG